MDNQQHSFAAFSGGLVHRSYVLQLLHQPLILRAIGEVRDGEVAGFVQNAAIGNVRVQADEVRVGRVQPPVDVRLRHLPAVLGSRGWLYFIGAEESEKVSQRGDLLLVLAIMIARDGEDIPGELRVGPNNWSSHADTEYGLTGSLPSVSLPEMV